MCVRVSGVSESLDESVQGYEREGLMTPESVIEKGYFLNKKGTYRQKMLKKK